MQTIGLTETEWLDSLRRLERYSFFMTPQWGEILSNGHPELDCEALLFRFSDGEVLFPCAFSRNRLGLRLCQSMPYGCYGGPRPLGAIPEGSHGSHGSQTEWARQILGYFGSRPFFGRLAAFPGPYPHLPLGQPAALHSTHLIDLSAGSEAVWKAFEKTVRSSIRKAERIGVTVKKDVSLAAFQEYYRMLEASSIRWGKEKLDKPWRLFEAISRSAMEKGNAQLWLAYHADQAVAGMLWFYGQGEAFYWSGAMYKNLPTRANELLMWSVIQDAVSKGYAQLNLGASGNLEGVYKFKQSFGAQVVEYPAYEHQSSLMRLARKLVQRRTPRPEGRAV